MNLGITFTIGGNPVKKKDFSQRLSSIVHVKDYRIEHVYHDGNE